MKVMLIVLFGFFCCCVVSAEELVLINGDLITGDVVGETDAEIYIETEDGLQSISKSDIAVRTSSDLAEDETGAAGTGESAESQIEEPSLPLDEQIVTQYYELRKYVVLELPKLKRKFRARVIPLHKKLMRWVQGTTVYKLALKSDGLRKYRGKNPVGFTMSIYCVLLLLAAVMLRIVKEAIFLVLGVFGVDMKQKRR